VSRKRAPAPAADATALPPPETLFAGIAGARGLVAAVSGGPDSTALMLLLSRWQGRPNTLVVTVDHGLRPEASAEAELVARNAERLGLPARTIRPDNPYVAGNLQAWARDARYACLADAAREAGADTIVTAHHRDDQAETFLLRLARGSGVYGLAAMAPVSHLGDLRLARPLLSLPRHALADLVEREGLEVVRDPSNTDPRFDRVAIRGLMPGLAERGLTAERLAGTAQHLARAADALDGMVSSLIAENFVVDACGTIATSGAALMISHDEIALRALARLVSAAAGALYTPRLDRLQALLRAIRAGTDFRRTMHGAVVSSSGGQIAIAREFGRNGLAFVSVEDADDVIWDRRFRLMIDPGGESIEVGPLGASGRRLASVVLGRRRLATLPGLYRGRNLIAAPAGIVADDGGPALAGVAVECLVGARLGLSSPPA